MRAGLRGRITWRTAGSCRKFLARKGRVSWLFPWGLRGASEEASAEDGPVSGRGLEHRTSHGQTASLRASGPAGRGCLGAHWAGCWKPQRRSKRGQGRWVFPGGRVPPLSDPEAARVCDSSGLRPEAGPLRPPPPSPTALGSGCQDSRPALHPRACHTGRIASFPCWPSADDHSTCPAGPPWGLNALMPPESRERGLGGGPPEPPSSLSLPPHLPVSSPHPTPPPSSYSLLKKTKNKTSKPVPRSGVFLEKERSNTAPRGFCQPGRASHSRPLGTRPPGPRLLLQRA